MKVILLSYYNNFNYAISIIHITNAGAIPVDFRLMKIIFEFYSLSICIAINSDAYTATTLLNWVTWQGKITK